MATSIERVWDERPRDQPGHPRDLGRVCREHSYLDGGHYVGRGRIARTQYLPPPRETFYNKTYRVAGILRL